MSRDRLLVMCFWALSVLLSASGALAQDPSNQMAPADDAPRADVSIEQTFSAPEEPRVGDPLRLTLLVRHPADTQITLSNASPSRRWELDDLQRTTTSSSDGASRTELNLTFRVFRPGSTTLPPIQLGVLRADGTLTSLSTEPVQAKIISVLDPEAPAGLNAPQPPVALWVDDYTLAWAGGGSAALLGALALFLALRRREQTAEAPTRRPPHVVALEKIERVSSSGWLERGDYMPFYVNLSEAIREYLGRRFGFHGTELTTTELLERMEHIERPDALSHDELRAWLDHCDLVKFSGYEPARREADQALRYAFAIVEVTTPKDSPEDQPFAEGGSTP